MSVCSRHFDKESLMAFVLTDGFATVSSFWRYHKIIKFTAASIAIHVQLVLQMVVTFIKIEWQRPIADMQIFTHQMRRLMRSDHFRRDLNLIWLDKIWSDQLDEPALAEVVDQRGVHKLVLKQIEIFYIWQIFVSNHCLWKLANSGKSKSVKPALQSVPSASFAGASVKEPG